MILQRQTKGKANNIVDIIWYIDEININDVDFEDVISPTGHIHLVYNFEDPYFVINNKLEQRVPNEVLVGQFKNALHIQYGKHVKQLGLAIRPTALFKLLNEFSGLYTEAIVDCSNMKSMIPIHESIKQIIDSNKENTENILECIESFFESIKYEENNHKMYEDMVGYINDRNGNVDIQSMAKHYNYSISSLERNFKKHLGLSPKAYSDIVRFRYSMVIDDPLILFYDQSHYIKNSMKYTAKAPKELAGSVELTLKYILGIQGEKI